MLGYLSLVLLLAAVQARGPLCLQCEAVGSPHQCTDAKECWPWESCFTEHFLFNNGSEAFTFGCRVSQQCELDQTEYRQKRFDLRLCSQCCSGDVCNNNICTNGTAPPPGLPCLSCNGVPTTNACSSLTYCGDRQVCYTEKSTSSPSLRFNMGCLDTQVCTLFDEEIINKDLSRDVTQSVCHECCEKAGCNYDGCAEHQETTTAAHQTTVTPSSSTPALTEARDCWDLRTKFNITKDGIYQVKSPNGYYVNHRCDMTTDGGGWIVFQKRFNGNVNFTQPYTKYQSGFGVLSDEFWMGNDLLHEFTKDKKQKLRVDICDWANTPRYAVYDFFSVGPPYDAYRLSVASYHGNAGDTLITGSGHDQYHNNRCFSTSDNDNDVSRRHCAHEFKSGWWFGDCFSSNLNGVYHFSGPVTAGQGLQWRLWREQYSFRGTEMKFRPASAEPSTHEPFKCPVH